MVQTNIFNEKKYEIISNFWRTLFVYIYYSILVPSIELANQKGQFFLGEISIKMQTQHKDNMALKESRMETEIGIYHFHF